MKRVPAALLAIACSCSDAPEASQTATPSATALDLAWSSFATCLVGPPLADGERAATRLAGIDLATLVSDTDLQASRRADWPQRCGPYLRELATTSPEIEAPELRRAAERIFALGFSNAVARTTLADQASPLDVLFRAAAAAGVRHVVQPDVPQPPAARAPPAPLTRLFDVPLPMTSRADMPDERFVASNREIAHACRPTGPQRIHCDRLPDRPKVDWVLVPRDTPSRDVINLVPRGWEREGAVLELTGAHAASIHRAAWAFPDGTLLGLSRRELRLAPTSGPTRSLELEYPKETELELVGDLLVSSKREGRMVRVGVASVTSTGATGPTALGEVPGESVDVDRRRGPNCDVLFVQTRQYGWGMSDRGTLAVTFRTGAEWSPFVSTELPNTDHDPTTFGRSSLSCDRDTARFETFSTAIDTIVCSRTSCTHETSPALGASASGPGAHVRLGDKLIAVLARSTGTPLHEATTAIELRVKGPGSAPATRELLAVDNAHGGLERDFDSTSAFVWNDRVYAFFSAREGSTYGVSIGPDGTTAPLTLE